MVPELFKIPGIGITIWTYGVMLDAAIVAGVWLAGRLGERDGLPRRQVYTVLVCGGLAAFVGAQFLGIVDQHQHADQVQRLLSQSSLRGAGSSVGALLIMWPVSALLMRAYGLPYWKSLDAFAPGIALASGLARIGCFAAGCCWGRPTGSWIGVRFTERAHHLTGVPTGEALIPTQLLLSVAGFLILGTLLWLRKRHVFEGQVILTFLMLYSVASFTIGLWRDDPGGYPLGLSTTQLSAAITFAIASFLYLKPLKAPAAVS